jgi:hypothetical protein
VVKFMPGIGFNTESLLIPWILYLDFQYSVLDYCNLSVSILNMWSHSLKSWHRKFVKRSNLLLRKGSYTQCSPQDY